MNATRKDQAERVVKVIGQWISASPGERSVTVTETSDGWRATMQEVRSCSGSSALDALAQVAVVAEVENGERRA